jgi:hypothetical protein
VDWDADPNWEANGGRGSARAALRLWREAVERSRSALAEALAEEDLGPLVPGVKDENGESPNLRRWMTDVIDEYARHNGHADLVRESIDGLVGEDPPD